MIKKIKPASLILILLLIFQVAFSQNTNNLTDYIKGKFTTFVRAVPREEIYAHTDRDEYISGENVWFNLYLIDRLSSKPSSDSKIAYLELLNQENRPIVQKKILLEDGFGPGQITLPDTLSTGNYTLRVYTNWMKNFLPYNCFMKDIRIYNAFSDRIIKTKIKSSRMYENSLTGTGASVGLTLNVNNLEPDFLNISVTANRDYRTANSNQFYLFIQTHGIINRVSLEMILDETTKILIPKKQLPPGINQITIFNAKAKPVAERFVYTPGIEKYSGTLQCGDSIPRRNKVTLNLDLGKELGGLNSDLSVSVAPKTNYSSMVDFDDYMVFGSEFGILPGKTLGYVPASKIDSLLMNAGSNWINWNIIMADNLPVYKYQVEKEQSFLSGKLLGGEVKKAEADKYVLLSTPGKTAVFQYARTDNDGNFSFSIHIDGKVKDLIIEPDIITKNQSINILSPFSDRFLNSAKTIPTVGKQNPAYISSWGVNRQVMAIYGNSTASEPVAPDISIPKQKRFYGKPDNELVMKDYIKLPVMQEVFFELIQGVSLDNKKTGWEITMNDPLTRRPYDVQPSLFIDGVKIKDPLLIASLDPETVERLDVIRERYYVGDYQFSGIVNVITNAGDFSGSTLPVYAMRLPYRVIDPVASFIAPSYSIVDKKKNHIPDFRNTLYWNPAVRPDQNGKTTIEFWASDFVSEFEVNVQGIASDGTTISIKKNFKVK